MRLIIVSGLSGSGKSVALNMLEDLDFYCVDNIPAGLLHGFIEYTVRTSEPHYQRTAVGVDARNRPEDLADVPRLVDELRSGGIGCEVVFLRAENEVLLKRFSETRRRHPLSRRGPRSQGSARAGAASARTRRQCGRSHDRHLAAVACTSCAS